MTASDAPATVETVKRTWAIRECNKAAEGVWLGASPNCLLDESASNQKVLVILSVERTLRRTQSVIVNALIVLCRCWTSRPNSRSSLH